MNGKTVATNEPNFMGRFRVYENHFNYSFDGRYLISHSTSDLSLIDLFHNKKIELRFDIPSANSVGLPLSAKEYHWIRTLYALDSHTMLILFDIHFIHYLAIGELDFDRSRVVFKHPAVSIDYYFSYKRWFPLSNPPNLHDGVILKLSDSIRDAHFVIKMAPDYQLSVSQLYVPLKMELFACFDGFFYGLVKSRIENNNYYNRPIELVKFSISSGEHFHVQTINWKIIHPAFMSCSMNTPNRSCCMGRTLLVVEYCKKEGKSKIYSLDLDTLEWKETNIGSEYSVRSIGGSDGVRTLIVLTENDVVSANVRRFVFNEPDKLSDLVWLRLKRIFDARPEAYKFILSQLPANFKLKCPFPQS